MTKKEKEFQKEQIFKSSQFTEVDKDLLDALLVRDKRYSLNQVEKILMREKKRMVK